MATRRNYRSSQGKSIDLGALLLQNETVRAVGNMGVNARGDRIDNRGAVVDSKVQQSKRQYNKQIGPQDSIPQASISQASRAPVADLVMPAPIAPDPYELQKNNAKEAEAFKEKRRAEKATAKAVKVSQPKVVKTPAVDESFLDIDPTPEPVAVAPAPAKGLADAIARAKTIKQEAMKTPRQQAQEKSGVKKI
jgi:hypothetical protein